MNNPIQRQKLLKHTIQNASLLLHHPILHLRFDFSPLPAQHTISHLAHLVPETILNLFVDVAGKFEFSWYLDTKKCNIDTDTAIYCGNMSWDIDSIEHVIHNKTLYEHDPEIRQHWKGIVPFMEIGTGDMIAVPDNSALEIDRVYYLSPNMPDCPVTEFKQCLPDFLLTWTQLACVNDTSLLQFRDQHSQQLSLDTDNSQNWINWLRDPNTTPHEST